MIRPIYTWILFALCAVLAVAAMGYVSWTALRLDRAESLARREATHEDNVRLALWRMDSKLAPLIAQENARPYFVYFSYYPAERSYSRMLAEIRPQELILPSPLLRFTSPEILAHFQVDPAGKITSPQVPESQMKEIAVQMGCVLPFNETASERLERIRSIIRPSALLAALPIPDTAAPVIQQLDNNVYVNGEPFPAYGQSGMPNSPGQQMAQVPEQQRKSTAEFSKRSSSYANLQQAVGNSDNRMIPDQRTRLETPSSAIVEGFLKPIWIDDLVLARRVTTSRGDYIQGCLLNWSTVRQELLDEIADLLPRADLQPVGPAGTADRPTRMMAALPVRLIPGTAPEDPSPVVSPIRMSLMTAWACVLLAVAAVGVLLRGAMSLSERRGAFVSAVTHELRTPLTTLRMYTEMLAEGMVRDEDKRRSYLQTLRVEADRLGHLVENVLAYSRIERGRARGHIVNVPVHELVDRARTRLGERAAQAGMNLVVEVPPAGETPVRADPSAVEQILFNLVDNACKYAASAEDRSIHVEMTVRPGESSICVRDHGPGITSQDGRRLFQPFSKSARDAANSAPGVGLGLALSRRLAREMGGDLRLDQAGNGGASFVLTLPGA